MNTGNIGRTVLSSVSLLTLFLCTQDVDLFTDPARLVLQAVHDSGGRYGFAGEQPPEAGRALDLVSVGTLVKKRLPWGAIYLESEMSYVNVP